MERRQFVRHLVTATIAIPAAKILAGCDSGQTIAVTITPTDFSTASGPPIDAATGPPVDAAMGQVDAAAASITYTSSSVAGHTHQVTLETVLFSSPPSAGVSRDTTVVSGHSHVVMLTQAELQSIAAGSTVMKDTSIAQNHTHTFTFTNSG
jgi:hypothetical protein